MSQKRTSLRLGSMFEVMEPRRLMATDVISDSTVSANPNVGPVYLKATAETRASDVNFDGVINHYDAHAVMTFLNARARQNQAVEGEFDSQKDVNGDGEVGPMDVMWIVNQIKQYDPLTPCDCASCSQPTTEARCENASISQTQSANLLSAPMTPAGESSSSSFDSLVAAQSVADFLNKRESN